MFGLGKKQPSRPEPVKPDDWDQRLPSERTRQQFSSSLAWKDAAESVNYPSPEAWSKDIGQQAIEQFWKGEGPVSQKEFMAQLNGWVYAWKASTYASLYVQVEAPDWGVTAILTITPISDPIYTPMDYWTNLENDKELQRRLLTPIEFDTFEVPAGPAAHASYQLRDFFNGENTTLYRDTVVVLPPMMQATMEISAATPFPSVVDFITEQTRLIADTLKVTPVD